MASPWMPDARPPLTRAEAALLAAAMLWPSILTWLYFIVLDGAPAPWPQVTYAAGKTLQFALPLVWLGGWTPGWAALRPWPRPTRGDLTLGLAWGLTVTLALAGLYGLWLKPAGLLTPAEVVIAHKTRSLGLGTPGRFAAAGLFYAGVHSLLEEYYWRWFVFGQGRRVRSLAAAVALSSLAFGTHHFLLLGTFFGVASPATWLLGLAVVVGGAIWAGMYQWRGNLYACWCSHALIDAALFAVGYDLIRG